MVKKKFSKAQETIPESENVEKHIGPSEYMSDSDEATEEELKRKYKGIETRIKPESFYSFAPLVKDGFGSKRRTFNVSHFHGVTADLFLNSGFVETDKSGFIRALVLTGLHSLCIQGDIGLTAVNNNLVNVAKRVSRVKQNNDRLRDALERIDLKTNKKSRAIVRGLLGKYGNNHYGKEVLTHISYILGRSLKMPTYTAPAKVFDGVAMKRAAAMTKLPLCDSMYSLDRDNEPSTVTLNMSKRYWGLAHDYRAGFYATGTITEVFRACFVTGLYCMSKWIIKNKYSKEEAAFYGIVRGLAAYRRDYF